MIRAGARTRTALLVQVATFLQSLWFIMPVWYLYATTQLHLSPGTAINLSMTIWGISALLDIPAGAVADRFGRKHAYLFGSILLCSFLVAYAVHAPFVWLASSVVASGVGQALISGALPPMVHRDYELVGLNTQAYRNFLAHNTTVLFIARACTGLTGAWLYSINPSFAYWGTMTVVLLSAGVVASIHEPEYKKKHLTTKAHMLDTFHLLWQKPSVRQMFTVYVLLAFTAEAVWTGYQALYAADGRATSTIGLLFSSIALCSALGSVLFEKHLQTLSATRFYLLYGMAVCATTTLLWQPNVSLRLLAIVPLGLVSGMLYTELRAKTQQHVPNAHHATALSIVSVCMMGTFIIASVCMGQIIQHLGLQAARQFVFVGSFCTLIFAILYLKKSIRSHDA